MSTNIELLMSLQRIDQSISEKKREAEEAARQLRALEAAVRQLQEWCNASEENRTVYCD